MPSPPTTHHSSRSIPEETLKEEELQQRDDGRIQRRIQVEAATHKMIFRIRKNLGRRRMRRVRKVCKPELLSTLSTAPTENEKANEIHGKRGSKQVEYKRTEGIALSLSYSGRESMRETGQRRQVLAEGLLARMHVSSS